MKFKKKPVVIDAWEYTGTAASRVALRELGAEIFFRDPELEDEWFITTMEGAYKLIPGHVVIRGVAGEFYPCDPVIFAQTYEPAE